MHADRLFLSLENFGNLLPIFLENITADDARWKPPSQNWSIIEIVRHLLDEELADFPLRIKMTLENPGEAWPSINPEIWAIERNYIGSDLDDSVRQFVDARQESVKWLRNLDHPNWFEMYHHPHLGPIRAGDLLVSWVAHDQLHVRQIAKRKYEMIERDAGAFSAGYAGGWS